MENMPMNPIVHDSERWIRVDMKSLADSTRDSVNQDLRQLATGQASPARACCAPPANQVRSDGPAAKRSNLAAHHETPCSLDPDLDRLPSWPTEHPDRKEKACGAIHDRPGGYLKPRCPRQVPDLGTITIPAIRLVILTAPGHPFRVRIRRRRSRAAV